MIGMSLGQRPNPWIMTEQEKAAHAKTLDARIAEGDADYDKWYDSLSTEEKARHDAEVEEEMRTGGF